MEIWTANILGNNLSKTAWSTPEAMEGGWLVDFTSLDATATLSC